MEHDPACCAPTPEDDRRIAEQALGEGDLGHAAHHIAGALAHDPHDPRHRMLVEQWVRTAPDPIALLPIEKGAYFGTVALRAWAHAHRGELDTAVDLLLQVAGTKPDVPFLPWLDEWLGSPEAMARLDAMAFAGAVSKAWSALEGASASPDEKMAFLRALGAQAARVGQAHPAADTVTALASISARRGGDVEGAIAIAERHLGGKRSYMVLVALGGALKETDRLGDAIAAFEEAFSIRAEPSCMLDVGDLQMQLGRRAEALSTYEKVLALEPGNAWAHASALRLRYDLRGDEDALRELERLAQQGDGRARELSKPTTRAPFVDFLPSPSEATIEVMRQAYPKIEELARQPGEEPGFFGKLLGKKPAPKPKPGGNVKITVSCLEAPSAHHCVARWLDDRIGARLNVVVQAVPKPDPRRPRFEVRHELWTYEGTDPSPAVPPPSAETAAAIAELARSPYDLGAWKTRAAALAQALGAGGVDDLLRVMVHPPGGPADLPPWDWMLRVQLAAALVIARAGDGWDGSAREAALTSLLHGPPDWTAIAAIVALTELALDEPELIDPILDHLRAADSKPPSTGAWCLEAPLGQALTRLDA